MLNIKQRKAAFELHDSTLLSASPGSGKTKTLVARASYKEESIPDKKTLALITYTNAAADEIATRLVVQTPIFIGTIHRFCLEFILRPFGWLYNWKKPRVVSYDELKLFIDNNKDIELGKNPYDELSKIKKDLEGNLEKNIEWDLDISLEIVVDKYYEYLNKINAIDFNEILYRSYKIISENSFVAKSLANKFYEILVDEFQDTNEFQYCIFKIIFDAGPVTFFMVGDERQRIYRFAGALPDAFSIAKKDFSAKHEILNETYRSSDNIIKAYSVLFDDHPELINRSEHKDFEVCICFQETKKVNHDDYLKAHVRKFVEKLGIKESEISILSTRWFDSLKASRNLRQDFNIVGLGALPHSTRSLNNSTFNLFRSLSKFCYKSSVGALRGIKRGIELHLLENNLSFHEKEIYLIQNKLISEMLKLDKKLNLEEGLTNISQIFFKTFNIEHSTFDDIISRIETDERADWLIEKYLKTLSGIEGITINTIHQAKGLEYDVVILDNINENRIPHQKFLGRQGDDYIYEELTEEAIDDGRNLFYVALSRAKRYLLILHNWKPSMFIEKIKNV